MFVKMIVSVSDTVGVFAVKDKINNLEVVIITVNSVRQDFQIRAFRSQPQDGHKL